MAWSRFADVKDGMKDAVNVGQDIAVPEAQYEIAFRLQVSRSAGIRHRPFRVLAAIQLDDQPCFLAKKIDHVGQEGNLSPKSEAGKPSASKARPQKALGFRSFAPQPSCK